MKSHSAMLLLVLAFAGVLGCDRGSSREDDTLHFWHTFNRDESAALQRWLDRSDRHDVAPTILPFAMANIRVRSALADGSCPDLVRMDATGVPKLASEELISRAPAAIWEHRKWLPEARELVWHNGAAFGVPQSLDGLALIHKRRSTSVTMSTLADLENFLALTKSQVGMLIDGYWVLAFLRAEGAAMPNAAGMPSIATPRAERGLERYAMFYRKGLAYDVLDERDPMRAIVRAFHRGDIDFVMSGPWELGALAAGKPEDLTVTAFPGAHAPRGGQVLVVPACAKHPARAWQLALAMSAPKLQAEWAQSLGSIPVTASGLREAGPLANAFYKALEGTRPLPRHARAPELFDDLSPAVSAVVSGDATAREALAGVARGWKRLYAAPEGDSP